MQEDEQEHQHTQVDVQQKDEEVDDAQDDPVDTQAIEQAEVINEIEAEIRKEVHKKILSLLNKLSDGNMDIIFKELHEVLMKYSSYPESLAKVYFDIFKGFCIDTLMVNSAILSVNCLIITAFQRLLGQAFFSPIIDMLYKLFVKTHKDIHDPNISDTKSQVMLKNIISIFTHFYLFESITHTLISDVIKYLLKNFKEKDIEMLLNLLHNIGAMLRKDSPTLCKDIILLCEAKKVEAKILNTLTTPLIPSTNTESGSVEAQKPITAFERKVKFLTEELNDIRNNKVSRHSKLLSSLKLYLNWLRTNSQVKSELLKNPLEIDFKTIEETKPGHKWWQSDEDKAQIDANIKINELEKKMDKSYLAELEEAAKAQHFSTDIQKSVFYTLMSCDDYLDAFQNLQKLGLKKKQEREIIKVSWQTNLFR